MALRYAKDFCDVDFAVVEYNVEVFLENGDTLIKKIGDIDPRKSYKDYCSHSEHNFPNMIVLPDGIYEHTCPACGTKQIVTIVNPRYENHSWTLDSYGPKSTWDYDSRYRRMKNK